MRHEDSANAYPVWLVLLSSFILYPLCMVGVITPHSFVPQKLKMTSVAMMRYEMMRSMVMAFVSI